MSDHRVILGERCGLTCRSYRCELETFGGTCYPDEPFFKGETCAPGTTLTSRSRPIPVHLSAMPATMVLRRVARRQPTAANTFISLNTGLAWDSCAPQAASLTNSCSPGYKGGEQLVIGEGYVYYRLAIDAMVYAILDLDPDGVNAAVNLFAVADKIDAKSSLSLITVPSQLRSSWINAQGTGLTPWAKLTMSQWQNALSSWIKSHPGMQPPPGLLTPPILTLAW